MFDRRDTRTANVEKGLEMRLQRTMIVAIFLTLGVALGLRAQDTAAVGLKKGLPERARAQISRLTEDEQNTVTIFHQASRGVVHISVRIAKPEALSRVGAEVSSGTGFIIDREGRILTAYHVIENADQVQVTINSGRVLLARLVGTAPQLDLALLQVNAPAGELVPLKLGDSDSLQVGQKIIAIGDPLDLHNTLTVGIISALGRSIDGAPPDLQEALIQTDAAVNPGNSGGPLLDSMGEVVGVTNAKIGGAQSLNFAIPVNFARQIIPDLIRMGHPYMPALGFQGSDVKPDFAELFGLPLDHGVLVEEVAPNGPAAEAGLHAGDRIVPVGDRVVTLGGDIITAVDGNPVISIAEIAHVLLRAHAGQTLRLTIFRNEQSVDISIPLQNMRMSSF